MFIDGAGIARLYLYILGFPVILALTFILFGVIFSVLNIPAIGLALWIISFPFIYYKYVKMVHVLLHS